MSTRGPVGFVLAGWVLLTCSAVLAADSARPNIIVIFTDDHGYADLSCQGILDDVRTPNIDSMAAAGVRMTSGYVTAPQCVPSRAGLMTGRYQTRFAVETNGDALDGFNAQVTIAERLRAAGYATGMSGKWHLGAPQEIPQHGFKEVFYKNSGANGWANVDLDGKDVPPGPEETGVYHIEANTRAACAFIERHRDEPFFFYLPYRAPHVPLDATEKYLARFPGEMPERRRKALAMLSAVDDGVGKVLETLRKHGLEERTLLFLIGDNGAPLKMHKLDEPGNGAGWDGSLNDPLNGEKGMLTEGGIRVPFVMQWKGVLPAGTVYDAPVISLDVAATALAITGEAPVPDLDGVNLVPYLTGEKTGDPHDLLFWRWSGQGAVRAGKWKYLQGGTRRYLFDLESDREEKANRIDEQPEVAKRLAAALEAWSKELTPPGLPPEMGYAGDRYFDFFLDGLEADPPPARETPPSAVRRPAGRDLFRLRDTNQDGYVTLDEFIGGPATRNVAVLTKRFRDLDRNGDGKWSREEL